MRISRPCYDKMHRCPGWAGGGMRFARVERCDDGRLVGGRDGSLFEGRFWRFRFNRCDTCGVVVLPYAIRWVDPSRVRDWPYLLRNWLFDLRYRWARR